MNARTDEHLAAAARFAENESLIAMAPGDTWLAQQLASRLRAEMSAADRMAAQLERLQGMLESHAAEATRLNDDLLDLARAAELARCEYSRHCRAQGAPTESPATAPTTENQPA